MTATAKRRPPNAGKGRPKGSVNKITASIKEAIGKAFDELGGVGSLVKWGKKNPDGFYQLWGRLAPKEVEVSGGLEHLHAIVEVPPKLTPEEWRQRYKQSA